MIKQSKSLLPMLLLMSMGSAAFGEIIDYTYDSAGRLKQVNHLGNVNDNVQYNYTFDDEDNRLYVNVTN